MSESPHLTDGVWDVAIVGAGPVGQTLALLLSGKGYRILVLEKHVEPYALPRAVHFTPDVARLLDQLSVMDAVSRFAEVPDSYDWQTADGQTLLSFGPTGEENQGWPWSLMFNQPGLERELLARIAECDDITLVWGAEVTRVVSSPDDVSLHLGTDGGPVRARFAVGCDGANSFVRSQINTTVNDLGFFYDWLVIDLDEKVRRTWDADCLQICDPNRPVSIVSAGPGKRRFEFMRMENDPDDFVTEASCWRLLGEWGVTPTTHDLERFTLYTFQSKWATNWFDDRVGIAGDAAHQVPPFFGVGMVSGMRDAANLAWKMDLVLKGVSPRALLDTYTSERSVEVQNSIGMSVELGKVICELDPERVAARNAHFLAVGPNPQDSLPPVPPERLGPGVLYEDLPLDAPWTGVLSVNERLSDATGDSALLDQLNYGGFTLILDAEQVTDDEARAAVAIAEGLVNVLAVRVTQDTTVSLSRLSEASPGAVVTLLDAGGVMSRHLAAAGYPAELIRPDFIVFGGHRDPSLLVDRLIERVRTPAV